MNEIFAQSADKNKIGKLRFRFRIILTKEKSLIVGIIPLKYNFGNQSLKETKSIKKANEQGRM
ncbi:hypothetical protein [Kaistella sp.]|uniref:hypothetical protein n=1 Tax=Kaistella sp. TaxID=2782235 RepID=UPI003C5842D3